MASRFLCVIAAVHATQGVLFTTEPTHAAKVLTVLSIAHTWQQAMDAWTALGFEPPPLHR